MKAIGLARFRLPTFGVGPQVVAVILVIGLVGAMAIEPTRRLVEQRTRISDMAGDLAKLERTNAQLEQQIARLNDPDFIEQRAREVGLVRQGEIPFLVVAPGKKEPKQDAKKAAPKPPEQSPAGFWQGFFGFIGF